MPASRRGAARSPSRASCLFLHLLFLLLVACAALHAPALAARCGTEAWFNNPRTPLSATPQTSPAPKPDGRPGSSGNGSSSSSASSASSAPARIAVPGAPPYRTLETPHFVLRYALHGLHAVKRLPQDSALYRTRDSLYAALGGLPAGRARDSAVLASLDGLSAPHPAFASVMAGFFEQARAYYVGSLGMKPPVAYAASPFYRAPFVSSAKYSVDIADAYQASLAMDPDRPLDPQTYGATLRPADGGGMLMENDFLWRSVLDPTGSFAIGDTLKTCIPRACTDGGALNRNYGLDWEAGLKVTCFHELYHAVQFAYTPFPSAYHAWYETGAVGMEERNAPEVDDYLQYLEGYFRNLAGTSMFDYMDILDYNPRYGNGIFHLFLTHELGERFDVGIWESLAANGNNLKRALPAAFAERGLTAEKVFGTYAAQLCFSGRNARAPFPLFSPDMARWPRLAEKPLSLDSLTAYRTASQPPFTIQAFRVSGSAAGKAVRPSAVFLVPVLASFATDTGTIHNLSGIHTPSGANLPPANLPLEWGGNAAEERLLVLANAGFEASATASIQVLASLPSAKLFAYPNPLRRTGDADRLLFSRLPGPARIRIVAENGVTVRELAFTADSALWSWDLRSGNGNGAETEKERPVLPGLYYFGTEGALAPLVIY